jgi:hypothetical protein
VDEQCKWTKNALCAEELALGTSIIRGHRDNYWIVGILKEAIQKRILARCWRMVSNWDVGD